MLKNGYKAYFAPLKSEVHFFGGAHCFIHDHIGAIKTLQKRGPTSKKPGRFFVQTSDDFSTVQHPNDREWINTQKFTMNIIQLEQLYESKGKK